MNDKVWTIPDPDTWMYHQRHAPEGRIFKASEVYGLTRKGWVDTPAKFGKGFRGRYYNTCLWALQIVGSDPKWAIETTLTFAGVLIALVALILSR